MEMSPTNPALVEAQMKALELARSTGQLPLASPEAGGAGGPALPPTLPYMPLNSGHPGLAEARLHRYWGLATLMHGWLRANTKTSNLSNIVIVSLLYFHSLESSLIEVLCLK